MPDVLVQLCLPAHWLGINIETQRWVLGKCNRYTCWFSPHNDRCTCKSVATDSNISAGEMQLYQTWMLIECNSNRIALWLGAIVTNMSAVEEQSLNT